MAPQSRPRVPLHSCVRVVGCGASLEERWRQGQVLATALGGAAGARRFPTGLPSPRLSEAGPMARWRPAQGIVTGLFFFFHLFRPWKLS